jgi:AraC-like DNA-binding protein
MNAPEDRCVRDMNDRIRDAMGFDIEYGVLDRSEPFLHRSATATINGLCMVATASTPLRVEVRDADHPAVLVPMQGKSYTLVERTRYEWNAGDAAVMLPAAGRSGRDTARSALFIKVDPPRLRDTACRMLGLDPEAERPFLDLDAPARLPLHAGGLTCEALFRQLCQPIDQFTGRPDLLDRSGLDDTFYRAMVMLLLPDRLGTPDPVPTVTGRSGTTRIGQLCDYIIANLDRRITLTELEALAGVSARTLQYAFRKRFDCTPKQWITEQRLLAVREGLLAAPPDGRVADVAVVYFPNLGDFATRYRRRFGETPSQTLARTRR